MNSRNTPYVVEVSRGETVFICRCGFTQNAPYCDGSHKLKAVETPLAHVAVEDGQIHVCGCGKSASRPFCDGSHL